MPVLLPLLLAACAWGALTLERAGDYTEDTLGTDFKDFQGLRSAHRNGETVTLTAGHVADNCDALTWHDPSASAVLIDSADVSTRCRTGVTDGMMAALATLVRPNTTVVVFEASEIKSVAGFHDGAYWLLYGVDDVAAIPHGVDVHSVSDELGRPLHEFLSANPAVAFVLTVESEPLRAFRETWYYVVLEIAAPTTLWALVAAYATYYVVSDIFARGWTATTNKQTMTCVAVAAAFMVIREVLNGLLQMYQVSVVALPLRMLGTLVFWEMVVVVAVGLLTVTDSWIGAVRILDPNLILPKLVLPVKIFNLLVAAFFLVSSITRYMLPSLDTAFAYANTAAICLDVIFVGIILTGSGIRVLLILSKSPLVARKTSATTLANRIKSAPKGLRRMSIFIISMFFVLFLSLGLFVAFAFLLVPDAGFLFSMFMVRRLLIFMCFLSIIFVFKRANRRNKSQVSSATDKSTGFALTSAPSDVEQQTMPAKPTPEQQPIDL